MQSSRTKFKVKTFFQWGDRGHKIYRKVLEMKSNIEDKKED
jgi:hypothetical protein